MRAKMSQKMMKLICESSKYKLLSEIIKSVSQYSPVKSTFSQSI